MANTVTKAGALLMRLFLYLYRLCSADRIITSQCGVEILERRITIAALLTSTKMPAAVKGPRTLYDKIWDDHVM